MITNPVFESHLLSYLLKLSFIRTARPIPQIVSSGTVGGAVGLLLTHHIKLPHHENLFTILIEVWCVIFFKLVIMGKKETNNNILFCIVIDCLLFVRKTGFVLMT